MRLHIVFALTLALGLAATGCREQYVIDPGALQLWRDLDADRRSAVAIPARREDGTAATVYPARLELAPRALGAAEVRGRAHTNRLTTAGAVVLGIAGTLAAAGIPLLVDGARREGECNHSGGWFCVDAVPGTVTVSFAAVALLGGATLLAAGLSQHPAE